jgi:cytochrome c-type biogenesis protein CcmH/NrfF
VVRHESIRVTDDGQKQMVTAHVIVLSNGRELGRMAPAKWFFRKHEEEPTTEVAIRRSFSEDLYVTLAGYEMQSQAATYKVTINPLVNWIWAGFGVMAVGTLIALLPESAFAVAAAKVPAGAVTTGLFLLMLIAPGRFLAQEHVESPQTVVVVPRTPLEKDMQRELVCICPTCGRKNIAECTCSEAARMRDELSEQVKLGKGRDDIRAWFVQRYGSQLPLGAPLDRGFNRLAWLFPYLVGGAGLLGVGIVVSRWKKKEGDSSPAAQPVETASPPTESRGNELSAGSTMSSVTSTKAVRLKSAATGNNGVQLKPAAPEQSFHPWQFFVLMSLAVATAAVLLSRRPTPEHLVLISLAIGAAGFAGYAAYRMLAPLTRPGGWRAAEPLGQRTRASLEREKMLTLRSIKELEFDRAMGKIAPQDFDEMTSRLRARALAIMQQLEERGASPQARPAEEQAAAVRPADQAKPSCHACGAANDTDARFCKRCGLKLAAILIALLAPSYAAAQALQMPDPKQMSGVPLPSGDLPNGTVSVRVVRGGPGNNLAGETVELTVAGSPLPGVKTDANGRAQFPGVAAGADVKARAVVSGETLESRPFKMPDRGGIRMMLVATDPEAAKREEESAKLAAGPAQPGIVVLGGDSRFVIETVEDALQVFYLLTVQSSARTPVETAAPLVFDLPTGASGATILEGSTPQARVSGARVTVTGPFPPGSTTVQVGFLLPHEGGEKTLEQKMPAALEQVLVVAEKSGDLRITSPQAPAQREMPADGKMYIVASGPAIAANGTLHVTVGGLTGHARWPRYVALSLAGIILLAGAWGAWTAPKAA